MNDLRRALPFLALPLVLVVAGCGIIPPAAASPSPVAEATPDAIPTPRPTPAPTPSPEPTLDPGPVVESLATLRERVAAWEAAGIDDYSWRIRMSCFCDPPAPLDVRVEDGEAIDVASTDGRGIPVNDLEDRILTVDDLFREMRRAIRRDGKVTATYGADGQPRSVTLDYVPNGDDDELYVETRRFEPAS